jgi:hypothetical protein
MQTEISVDRVRANILAKIDIERYRQNGLWGTEFDDKNTFNDWVSYVCRYVTQGHDLLPFDQRECFIKTAALCVAAVETIDRCSSFARTHYE